MNETVSTTAGDLTISDEHPGGNGTVLDATGSVVRLAPELRDSVDRPMYWNVAVESDADGQIEFRFPECEVVGPWGPANSAGDEAWTWLGADARRGPSGFAYDFEPGERVQLAFSLPYQRAHLDAFYDRTDDVLERRTLATTRQGREVPLLHLGDPSAEAHVLLAARHHACESPASYVLEGLLDALASNHRELLDRHQIHALPLVDVDGVARGDQGKHRAPHDHNRDYPLGNALVDAPDPLYRSTAAIQSHVRSLEGPIALALDLHCPWKWGRPHDRPHFYGDPDAAAAPLADLAAELAAATADRTEERALQYVTTPGIGFAASGDTGPLPAFSDYCAAMGARLSATLEVPYFGLADAHVTPDSCRQFGAALAAALAARLGQDSGGAPS